MRAPLLLLVPQFFRKDLTWTILHPPLHPLCTLQCTLSFFCAPSNVPSFFLGTRQCTRFLTGHPLLYVSYVCVTEFELHHHLVSAVRPASSYFVDVHFFRASTCNGFYLLCVHTGRCSKFPVAKKVSIECHENCNVTFIYFFPFDPDEISLDTDPRGTISIASSMARRARILYRTRRRREREKGQASVPQPFV
jgi:hypothetical protein